MTTDAIRETVRVGLAPEQAFDLFTRRIGEWWPVASHSVSAGQGEPSKSLTLEPALGGALTETGHDGTIHVWGHVEEWEPGRVVAMTWHPGKSADNQTRVRVEFEPEAEGTRVTLTHSGWEVLGPDAAKARNGYNEGWVGVLDRYRAAA